MRRILVLGAGQSSPFLIEKLLEDAEGQDWHVTVADRDGARASARVDGHRRGEGLAFDVNDLGRLGTLVRDSNVVVNFLSPVFQHRVARTCVEHGVHMVSASYRDQRLRELDAEAKRRGCVIVNEAGLDPGIDHMSAMELIDRVRAGGGRILKFASYGSGVPAAGEPSNQLGYFLTWNPRNVVMAGEGGAQYLVDGLVKVVPYHEVFHRSWRFEVPGIGPMEAYPNRDSLAYQAQYGLHDAQTVIRGTLRNSGWSETWYQIVKLGLPNESLRIPRLAERTWAELMEMFLPRDLDGVHLEQRVAGYLGVSPTGTIIRNMRWLGLFETTPCAAPGETMADALVHLLAQRLALPPSGRDMVIIAHELVVERAGQRVRFLSTMVERGTAGGMTAMAKTVGLPAALVTRLIMEGGLEAGILVPTHPAIYQPLLGQLAAEGIRFDESTETVEPGASIS